MKTAEGKVASIHHSGIYDSAPVHECARRFQSPCKGNPNRIFTMLNLGDSVNYLNLTLNPESNFLNNCVLFEFQQACLPTCSFFRYSVALVRSLCIDIYMVKV